MGLVKEIETTCNNKLCSAVEVNSCEDIKKLLDVVSSIIADEYIRIAKQNPETFSNNGGQK